MASIDPPEAEDPDDWFAGPTHVAPRSTPPTEAREPALREDDWLGDSPTARSSRGLGRPPSITRAKAAVASLVVVGLILAGLAVAGVFSGSGHAPAVPPTTATTGSATTGSTSTAPNNPASPIPAAPASALKPGDNSAKVKLLQRALARLGFRVGVVDGIYGPATQAAVTSFQKVKALTADGIVGPQTLRALRRALSALG
jgi:hypothetical protein